MSLKGNENKASPWTTITGAGIQEHITKRHQHRERPCPNPPAVPTNITLTFQATEALTHLRFTGKLKWDEVTEDEQGHGSHIDRYEAQILACDAGGVPIETEDSKARIRIRIKQPPHYVAISQATNPSGSTFRFVTRKDHGQSVGNIIIVSGLSPSAYNGTWTVGTVVNTTTLEVTGGSSGVADSTNHGTMTDADDTLHVIWEKVPRPKTWRWKARIRSVDTKGCRGDWSAWTSPLLPWTGADPQPPAPTFGANPITFDNKGKGKVSKVRLKFTYNEVEDFDYPGTPAEDEEDVIAYWIQMDRSDDGVTWDGAPYRAHKMLAKDNDADGTRTAIFLGVRRRYWYRCRVRCVDRFNRKSPWSNWTDAAFPFDDDRPPQPLLVRIFESATDRVVMDWEDPLISIPTRGTVSGSSGSPTVTGTNSEFEKEVERGSTVRIDGNDYLVKSVASATSLTLATNLSTSPSGAQLRLREDDPDVAFYQVQIAKSADVSGTPNHDWAAIYAKDRRDGTRKAFKVPQADQGLTFFGRVRSVDAAWNKSKWVYGRYTANSDETLNGQGVTIGAGGGGTLIPFTFTKPGRLRIRHYPHRLHNTTDAVLEFRRARLIIGRHDKTNHPNDGAPGGSPVRVQLVYGTNKVGSLTADITDVATSMTVLETYTPPATTFKAMLEDEQINVTNRVLVSGSTYTYTIQRAQGGTTGVAHLTGTYVEADPEESLTTWDPKETNLFDVDTRLVVPTGTHKDVNHWATFQVTNFLPGDWVTVNVKQVGSSTSPGEDLSLTLWCKEV